MGTQMQGKARTQDGHPNEKSIRNENVHTREPKRNTRHVRKFGAPMQRKLHPQVGRPNAHPQRKRKARPQRKACPHVRKLGAPMQRKLHPQVGHPNAHPQRKSKEHPHVRKLGAATQRKARPQYGCPNAKRIRNGNFHTREH